MLVRAYIQGAYLGLRDMPSHSSAACIVYVCMAFARSWAVHVVMPLNIPNKHSLQTGSKHKLPPLLFRLTANGVISPKYKTLCWPVLFPFSFFFDPLHRM